MAKKLVEQDDAARMLGVTVEKLNSLRDMGKLYPKRDGGEWKYDVEDLERYKNELADEAGGSWETLGLGDIQLEDNTDPDSILTSEAELGESAETTKSTIIGRAKNAKAAAESDIRLAGDSDLSMKADEGTGSGKKPSSDIDLLSGSSDLEISSDSGLNLTGSGKGSGLGSSVFDAMALEKLESGDLLGSGSLKLSGDDEISLGDSPSDRAKKNKEHDTAKGESGLLLAGDDELVLGGGSGSDLTLGTGDSGIMLVDPADSGLSLEQPLKIGGSKLGSSLAGDELTIGEDDMITLEEDVDLEGATQLRADNFDITPGGMGDDDSDSGSQVIALDSEDDLSQGNMFGSGDSLIEPVGVPMADALTPGAMAVPGMMPVSAIPEAPYSVWNIMALLACVIFLMLGGMMIYDLNRVIWSWSAPTTHNSAIMDAVVGMFEGK